MPGRREGFWRWRRCLIAPRAAELDGQENIRRFMRQNWLSNRAFESFDDIVQHCYYAGNTLIDQPCKIISARAAIGQPWLIQCDDWHYTGTR